MEDACIIGIGRRSNPDRMVDRAVADDFRLIPIHRQIAVESTSDAAHARVVRA
jgi:hypothetical protein